MRHAKSIDFLELIADNFFGREPAQRALAALSNCAVHSLKLNVGASVSPTYLAEVAKVIDVVQPAWFSDHLAFTEANGVSAGHMAPVAFTKESLATTVRNVRVVQDRIGRPFALENIAAPFEWPHDEMSEAEFMGRLVSATGCKILLDLENVRVNSGNHGRVARDYLDSLPLESVIQVHVAGGTHGQGLLHDSHSRPVSDDTWALLDYICDLVEPPAVLLERDQAFPPFADILAELDRARRITRRRA